MQDAVKEYKETSISTQNRGKLIVMLYDGAIEFLQKARKKLEEKDYEAKGRYINRAQAIISELNNSLNTEADPALAQNLRGLYNFMFRKLSKANLECDTEMIGEIVDILRKLRDAWEQAAREAAAKQNQPGEDGQTGQKGQSAGLSA
ncbi:MAG: flagellar export chaperone FliS [Candidatus Brocadiia bacterium]